MCESDTYPQKSVLRTKLYFYLQVSGYVALLAASGCISKSCAEVASLCFKYFCLLNVQSGRKNQRRLIPFSLSSDFHVLVLHISGIEIFKYNCEQATLCDHQSGIENISHTVQCWVPLAFRKCYFLALAVAPSHAGLSPLGDSPARSLMPVQDSEKSFHYICWCLGHGQ